MENLVSNSHISKRKLALIMPLLILFSSIVFILTGCSFNSKAKYFNTLDELNTTGTKFGIATGTIHDAITKERFPNASYNYYEKDSEMAFLVKNGALDAFLCDKPTAEALIGEVGNQLSIIPEVVKPDSYGFVFAKNPTGETLAQKFNAFLSKAKNNGLYDTILDKWFGKDKSKQVIDESIIPSKSESSGTLNICISSSVLPFCMPLNSNFGYGGFSVDLAVNFCHEENFYPVILDVNPAAEISMITSGKCDMIASSLSITSERMESVKFSDPIYEGGVVVISRNPNYSEKKYNNFEELNLSGKNIGFLDSTPFDDFFDKCTPNANKVYFRTIPDMAVAATNDSIDGFFLDEGLYDSLTENYDGLDYLDEPAGYIDVAAMFPKSENGHALCLEFNNFLSEYKTNNSLEDLYNKWSSFDDETVLTIPKADSQHRTIKLAVYSGSAPFAYIKNGKPAGFEVELMSKFCESKGYGLEVVDVDFSGLITGVTTEIYDVGASSINVTDDRKENAYFSDAYYKNKIVMVVKKISDAKPFNFFEWIGDSFNKTFIKEGRWKLFLSGIVVTINLSICSGLLGTIIGFGICWLRMRKNPILSSIAKVIIKIMQGVPIVVFLMILFYLVFAKVGVPGEIVAIIAFSLNFGAYVSEMMRTGIESVDKGQMEAALSLGYTRTKGFIKVVFPQAMKHFLPVYKGEFISMVKMTSIVGYVAVQDLTKVSDIVRSNTYEAFFPLIMSAIFYFAICWGLTSLLRLIEVKIEPDRNKKTIKGVKLHD